MGMKVILGMMGGSCMASFAYCLAQRLALQDHALRSHCPYCKRSLQWYDLIPVLGYLWQKGHCRFCGRPIPPGSFWMELLFGALGGYGMALDAENRLIDLCLLSILLCASVHDRMTLEIPDRLHIAGVLLFLFSRRNIRHGYVLALLLWMIANLYKHVRKGTGFGAGDCKLLLWIGFFFTLRQMCIVLLTACCAGMIEVYIRKRTKIAFAPCIFFGVLTLLFLRV